jgi:hypothetical protein
LALIPPLDDFEVDLGLEGVGDANAAKELDLGSLERDLFDAGIEEM